MQTVSDTYNSIIVGNHWFEAKLEIREPDADISNLTASSLIGTYPENEIFSISTSSEMLSKTFTIGSAVAAEIDIKMVKPSENIPPMAMLIPYVRACNSETQSEWIKQGIFFIDTRKESRTQTGEEVLILHGYDAMLKSEQMHTAIVEEWDKTLVKNIAKKMGLKDGSNNALVDPRTWDIIPNTEDTTNNYKFPVTMSYAMRDTLRHIACAYAGWFVITDNGYLRLVSTDELPHETSYLVTERYSPITFGGTRILI